MTVTIGRRELLAALGGVVAAWPLAARAQQAGKLPTIGYLGPTTPTVATLRTAAFVQRLRDLGWTDGRNIASNTAGRRGIASGATELAAEFVRRNVDVFVTVGLAEIASAKRFPASPIWTMSHASRSLQPKSRTLVPRPIVTPRLIAATTRAD